MKSLALDLDLVDTRRDLLRYLDVVVTQSPHMRPLESLVLEYGRDYRGAKRPAGLRKQRDRMCFKNAARLALRDTALRYVEGFAIHRGLIPVFHAWCATVDDVVVDPTWKHPELSVYRGVPITHETLTRQLTRRRVYGVLDYGSGIDLELIERIKIEDSGGPNR